jgi:hypothetical protein
MNKQLPTPLTDIPELPVKSVYALLLLAQAQPTWSPESWAQKQTPYPWSQ